jgi:hypothetical protein
MPIGLKAGHQAKAHRPPGHRPPGHRPPGHRTPGHRTPGHIPQATGPQAPRPPRPSKHPGPNLYGTEGPRDPKTQPTYKNLKCNINKKCINFTFKKMRKNQHFDVSYFLFKEMETSHKVSRRECFGLIRAYLIKIINM